jgi:beta-lactamase regulating signal transducer with metallopeptidase domain
MPFGALLSLGILRVLGLFGGDQLHGHGALRYALLVGPTLLPLAWLVSACLHQAESGTHPDVCVGPEQPGVLCPEVAFFAAALVVLVSLVALPQLLRQRRTLFGSPSAQARAVSERIAKLQRECGDLHAVLGGRVLVRDDTDAPISTLGLGRPCVVVNTEFAAQLDDAALRAALWHEAEHVRDRDPLRYFVIWWALTANPLGHLLLGAEFRRWIVAREAHCDREAVLCGATPSALAEALVRAARFRAPRPRAPVMAVGLHTEEAAVLRLRVNLLLAYAEAPPRRCCREHALSVAAVALLAALALPHLFGAGPLDALHTSAESAFAYFLH